MSGKLYVVGTPIGNLGDFSPRGVETLGKVDFIAAEDTRVTTKLLNYFNIKKPLISYFEHNKAAKGEIIINRILDGENCALVTDAGMPAISDPGQDLIALAHKNKVPVESVPGPTALTTALALSGLSTGRFCFEGFLSVNKLSRKQHLESLKHETRTMCFYEAPHKLVATLKDMLECFGEREIALVKEITKLHENVFKTTFSGALAEFNVNAPKGEYVLLVSGFNEQEAAPDYTLSDAKNIALDFVKNGLSPSDAAKQAAKITGLKKGDIYKLLVNN
ncbi:MAG: 16S rRNA (cytidine(1402)-2'-O)-methyltransferase [Clostridia bacterium]|nr:16S rRNA (cytidine(1402)-2'-O)-methyltransferase [Clostridia bacterium]